MLRCNDPRGGAGGGGGGDGGGGDGGAGGGAGGGGGGDRGVATMMMGRLHATPLLCATSHAIDDDDQNVT